VTVRDLWEDGRGTGHVPEELDAWGDEVTRVADQVDGLVPDPTSEPDGRWLRTADGAYVLGDPPAGGGGGDDPAVAALTGRRVVRAWETGEATAPEDLDGKTVAGGSSWTWETHDLTNETSGAKLRRGVAIGGIQYLAYPSTNNRLAAMFDPGIIQGHWGMSIVFRDLWTSDGWVYGYWKDRDNFIGVSVSRAGLTVVQRLAGVDTTIANQSGGGPANWSSIGTRGSMPLTVQFHSMSDTSVHVSAQTHAYIALRSAAITVPAGSTKVGFGGGTSRVLAPFARDFVLTREGF
jgi:hypothetical protein